MTIEELIEVLNEKFTSGNNIPVDCASITKEEYEIIKRELNNFSFLQKLVKKYGYDAP